MWSRDSQTGGFSSVRNFICKVTGAKTYLGVAQLIQLKLRSTQEWYKIKFCIQVRGTCGKELSSACLPVENHSDEQGDWHDYTESRVLLTVAWNMAWSCDTHNQVTAQSRWEIMRQMKNLGRYLGHRNRLLWQIYCNECREERSSKHPWCFWFKILSPLFITWNKVLRKMVEVVVCCCCLLVIWSEVKGPGKETTGLSLRVLQLALWIEKKDSVLASWVQSVHRWVCERSKGPQNSYVVLNLQCISEWLGHREKPSWMGLMPLQETPQSFLAPLLC